MEVRYIQNEMEILVVLEVRNFSKKQTNNKKLKNHSDVSMSTDTEPMKKCSMAKARTSK